MSQEYTPVFYHNFTKSFDTLSFEHKIACDGCVYRDMRGLTVESSSYCAHTDPGITGLLDHIKWLAFLRKSYNVCEGEFVYEACMSAQQIISPEMIPPIYRNRIRDIHEDYRLCSSALVVYDEESMITAQIFFTDSWIYGGYERRPGYKTGWIMGYNPVNIGNMGVMGDYAAFSSVIPLCKRGNFGPMSREGHLDDFIRVGIGIDPVRGTLKFYVNRIEMFCIPRIGYRLTDEYQVSDLGGIPYLTVPGTLRFGFGHFSYLDHNMPNNYSRKHVIDTTDSNGYPVYRSASGLAQLLPTDRYREPYPDFTGEHTSIDPSISFAYSGTDPKFFIFGQGMITRIKYIAGYIVNNKIKMHKMLCNKAFICNGVPCEDDCDCCNHSSRSAQLDYVVPTFKMSGFNLPMTQASKYCDEEEDYGPVPQASRNVRPYSMKHEISVSDIFNRNTIKSHQTPSTRIPLYKDYSSQSSDKSSYSLGDLYRKSRSRRFLNKGESDACGLPEHVENDVINNRKSESNSDIEQIAFVCDDMSLNI